MNFLIILKVAMRSLRRTLLRSGLTALGIIIGVGAVIAMVSIGNGAKAQIESSLAGLDTNQLTVSARMPRDDYRGGRPTKVPHGDGLTLQDYTAIQNDIRGISVSTVQTYAPAASIKANGRSSDSFVSGVDVGGLLAQSRKLVRGAAFGLSDVRTAASVCLITEFIAKNLFANREPVGKLVRIGETPFTVIGVMADSEGYRDAARPDVGDTTVMVPYTSLLQRLDRTAPISITVKAQNPGELATIQRAVSDLMEQRRGVRKAEFVTGNVEEAVRTYREGSQTMTLLLAAIGGISLLVGGIGIMNIMLVSVTERTREIGIRMAIGTRGGDVLRQFLIESMILSVLGGTIGILVGVGVARLLTYLNDWPTQVTIESVLGAFLFSAAIGIFFGYYPARQAAQLDPIEALRAE